MEALTAPSITGLALYDMLKALPKEKRLDGLRLLTKSGGQSGDWRDDFDTEFEFEAANDEVCEVVFGPEAKYHAQVSLRIRIDQQGFFL